MSGHTLAWWDPARDPGHAAIRASALALARADRPDVLLPSETPAGFQQMVTLCEQRARSLQVAAIEAASSDVEFVVANFHLLSLGLVQRSTTVIPDLQASSVSRARAKESDLARQILLARERVITMHAAHEASLANAVAYATDAIADLDRLVRSEHRFGHYLRYQIPTVMLPDDVREIGLARVHAVLPSAAPSGAETEPDSPINTTERGVA